MLLIFVVWGIVSAPFDWDTGIIPRDPVPVDAIPDIGENQQIVYTEWPGRSPQDIEDQISYQVSISYLMRMLNSTGAGQEYSKSSIPCLQEPYLKMLHRPWDLMQRPLDKYIGTPLKGETRKGIPLEDGIPTN